MALVFRKLSFAFDSFRSRHIVFLERSKHYNPKYKKERAAKFIKIKLPDYETARNEDKMSVEEMRSVLKERGTVPGRKWSEKPAYMSCSANVFEPYLPPEGDGKMSIITMEGLKQKGQLLAQKTKTFRALRKIRNMDYQFDVPTLAEKAKAIYIEAHDALAAQDEEKLHELVTEKCFPEMMENIKNKTVYWKFIQSLEIPRVVHIRRTELMDKCHTFAQATVRFHTQQKLAVYDRFGRLMYGSEDRIKDVLEYVVFEKHLTNIYGVWRIHSKIIPDWIPDKENILKTFHKPEHSFQI